MIDTFKVMPEVPIVAFPPGWEAADKRRRFCCPLGGQTARPEFTFFTHKKTKMRVGAFRGQAKFIEVSFPRLLNRPPGWLVKKQAEVDEAIKVFTEIASRICDLEKAGPLFVERIDLCAHVPIKPATLVRLYQHCKLPKIHALPLLWPEESLFWRGSPRKLRMYDKQLQLTKEPGELTRIEWQIGKQGIPTEFGGPLPLAELSIEKCYQVFRHLTEGLQPKTVIPKNSKAHLLAMALAEDWRFEGVPYAELIKEGVHEKTFARNMREGLAALRTLKDKAIDLSGFFPDDFESYRPLDVI